RRGHGRFFSAPEVLPACTAGAPGPAPAGPPAPAAGVAVEPVAVGWPLAAAPAAGAAAPAGPAVGVAALPAAGAAAAAGFGAGIGRVEPLVCRKAMTLIRSSGFFRPTKVIFVPGI